MASIFVSYRRSDAAYAVDRLARDLDACFGAGAVYQDTMGGIGGDDVWQRIRGELAAASVVLVVVSPEWFSAMVVPGNYARREVECALAGGARVVPVLVGPAPSWPGGEGFPASVRALSDRLCALNWMRLRPDPDYDGDLERLCADLEASALLTRRPGRPAARASTAADRALAESRELLLAGRPAQAASSARRVLDADGLHPRANLYLAVARAAGRSLKMLSCGDAAGIEAALETAATSPEAPVSASARWLLAVLRHDYHFQNGIAVTPTFAQTAAELAPALRARVDRPLVSLVPHSDRIRRILAAG